MNQSGRADVQNRNNLDRRQTYAQYIKEDNDISYSLWHEHCNRLPADQSPMTFSIPELMFNIMETKLEAFRKRSQALYSIIALLKKNVNRFRKS